MRGRERHPAMRAALRAAGVAVLVLLLAPGEAAAGAHECGGEVDDCPCGGDTPCICCECGNCVWWAWHEACCHWGIALEWCTDAGTWDDYASDYGYPLGTEPRVESIFVCEPSSVCSAWGHVGWLIAAYPDGSFDSTEMSCGGWCGVQERNRPAGFAEHFIYSSAEPPEVDDAAFVSETIPDGTRFGAGEAFVKRWTVRNTGNTTWTRGESYVWAWDEGERFSADAETQLAGGASVAPDDTYGWEVSMTAPAEPGTYRGWWTMDHVGTGRFGERCWVEIVVDEAPPPDEAPEPEEAAEPVPDAPADAAVDGPAAERPLEEAPEVLPDLPEPPRDASIDALPEGNGAYVTEGGCSCTTM